MEMGWLKLRIFPHTHHHTVLKQGSPLLYLYLHKAMGKAFDDAINRMFSLQWYILLINFRRQSGPLF